VRWVEPIAGALLMALVLADVFLTVLYARAGTEIISSRLARLVWLTLRRLASGSGRSHLLSFCGPFIVVALLLTWSILLALGAGLIVHPQLGTNITNGNQGTPTDFVTALYVAGSSLSIVGGSSFAPQSAGAKLLFLLNSVIGTSVISLTITYLMQIYGALRSRNSLCLKIHTLSGETGDAAELLAHLFANNQLSAGYNNLSELASEVTAAKEAHHFYPVLFYFRFPEPHYSVSRSWLGRAGCCLADPKRITERSRMAQAIGRCHPTVGRGAATPFYAQQRLSAGEVIVCGRRCGSPSLAHPVRDCRTAAAGSWRQRNGRSSAFVGLVYRTEKKVGSPHPTTWQLHGLPAVRNRYSHARASLTRTG
jgi:hypothetical protein